jgi:hypothetical protein
MVAAYSKSTRLIRSKSVRQWYMSTNIMFLDIIHHPVFICVLKNKQDGLSDKDRTMDKVQKHNICTRLTSAYIVHFVSEQTMVLLSTLVSFLQNRLELGISNTDPNIISGTLYGLL